MSFFDILSFFYDVPSLHLFSFHFSFCSPLSLSLSLFHVCNDVVNSQLTSHADHWKRDQTKFSFQTKKDKNWTPKLTLKKYIFLQKYVQISPIFRYKNPCIELLYFFEFASLKKVV
jgi:hypothetical protein